MAEGLSLLLLAQWDLQVRGMHIDPMKLDGDAAIQYAKDMKLAMESELQEFLDEMSWKPWAQGYFYNRLAARKEAVDMLHFWMNMVLLTAESEDVIQSLARDVVRKYTEKRQVNFDRQAQGYDGVSTKCPWCKRAIEDGIKQSPMQNRVMLEYEEGHDGEPTHVIARHYQTQFLCECGEYNYFTHKKVAIGDPEF